MVTVLHKGQVMGKTTAAQNTMRAALTAFLNADAREAVPILDIQVALVASPPAGWVAAEITTEAIVTFGALEGFKSQ